MKRCEKCDYLGVDAPCARCGSTVMNKAKPASGCTGPSDCWPLPPEWDTTIPPQPVVVRYGTNDHYRTSYTVPEWNKEWLRGLESFVRSIIRDEISKANNPPCGKTVEQAERAAGNERKEG